MRLTRKEIEGRAGLLAFSLLKKWVQGKSVESADRLGARLGRLAFRLARSRRKRTVANLEIAFPEKTSQERMQIAEGVFVHFGRILCDFLRNDTRSKQEVLNSIELDGFSDITEMIPAHTGLIILTGHFGNWERIGQYMVLSGYPLAVVVRDADDTKLNDLVENLRKAAGLEVIARGSAARAILLKLKRGEPVAILPDQNSDESFPCFFGKPCGTVLGPAVLAQRGKSPIYITFCYRTGPGRYKYRLMEVIDPTKSPELTPGEIMARFNMSLEAIVREFPDQYLWMHNRWKSAFRRGLL